MYAIFAQTASGLTWIEAFDTQAEAQSALGSGDYAPLSADFLFMIEVKGFVDMGTVREKTYGGIDGGALMALVDAPDTSQPA